MLDRRAAERDIAPMIGIAVMEEVLAMVERDDYGSKEGRAAASIAGRLA